MYIKKIFWGIDLKPRTNLIKDIKKIKKQGRSLGSGCDYQPGLKVSDVQSLSVRSRIFFKRFNRHIHVMSNSEKKVAMILEWDDNVIDIKEQIHLDPNKTLFIAKELGYKHPKYKNEYSLMTTDFLVTKKFKKDNSIYRAYQVKKNIEEIVNNKRVIEKLKIEKEYWYKQCIPWCIIYSDSLNEILYKNLNILYQYRNVEYSNQLKEYLHKLIHKTYKNYKNIHYNDFHVIKY